MRSLNLRLSIGYDEKPPVLFGGCDFGGKFVTEIARGIPEKVLEKATDCMWKAFIDSLKESGYDA